MTVKGTPRKKANKPKEPTKKNKLRIIAVESLLLTPGLLYEVSKIIHRALPVELVGFTVCQMVD